MTVTQYDLESVPPFLEEDFFREANTVFHFSEAVTEAFVQAIGVMREDATLRKLALESHRNLYRTTDEEKPGESVWPEPSELAALMGGQAGMFAAVVLISGLPKTMEFYRSKKIAPRILADTMSDVEIWMRHYYRKHGEWGLDNVGWLKLHMNGRLFRLGRLQFVHDPLYYKIHVFRNRVNGRVIAFPDTGMRFMRDGLVDGTNDRYDTEGGWTSRLDVTDQEIIGTPFSAAGYALPDTVRLPKAEWRPVLAEGDPVLHVHIPEGSKMAHKQCLDSYRQALEFYPKHFPELSFAGFACGSWLLSPQFRQLLPGSSNIVLFQNDYVLFPILSHDGETLSRVFGEREIDPRTAPRDTLLRRAILDYMARGERMYGTGGFILREHAVEDGLKEGRGGFGGAG